MALSITLGWQFGLVGSIAGCIKQVTAHRAWLVLGWLTCKPSQYVTSYPWQLSLAIPSWVSSMSTIKKLGCKQVQRAMH